MKPTPDPDTYDASRLETATFPVWTNTGNTPTTVDILTDGTLQASWPWTGENDYMVLENINDRTGTNRSFMSIKNINGDSSLIITNFNFAACLAGSNVKVAWSKSIPNRTGNYNTIYDFILIAGLTYDGTATNGLANLKTNANMDTYSLGRFTDANVISVTTRLFDGTPGSYTQVTLPGTGIVLRPGEFLNLFFFDTDAGKASIIRTRYIHNDRSAFMFNGQQSLRTDERNYISIYPGFQKFNLATNSPDLATSLGNYQATSGGLFGWYLMPFIKFTFNSGTIPYTSPGSIRYLATTSSSFTALQLKPIFDLGSDTNWAIFNIYRASIETSSQSFLLMSSSGSPYTVFYIDTSGTFSKMSLATSSSPMDYTKYNGTWKLETGPDTDGKYLVFYNTAGTGGAITKWTLQTDLTFNTTGTSPLELKCSKCSSVGMCFG